jgi:uncharacterized membrane protein YdcZ (DUF606 family)
MNFFSKIINRVGFYVIFFLIFQQRDMWFLSRCESIRTAERPSREWAYFGGLLFGNYVIILWGGKVL